MLKSIPLQIIQSRVICSVTIKRPVPAENQTPANMSSNTTERPVNNNNNNNGQVEVVYILPVTISANRSHSSHPA
jgi:hypothetical protein